MNPGSPPAVVIDWSDGDYGRFARTLEPAARQVVAHIAAGPDMRVIDVGCGTGNAALCAAAAGASVRAVDPAPGLLDELGRRAQADGLTIERVCLEAEALPEGDFDAAISVFAVIFAADAPAALRGLVRSARIGGRVALTSWRGDGALAAIAAIIRPHLPVPAGTERPMWEDPAWVARLLEAAGAHNVTVTEHAIVHRGPSPTAWLEEIERLHPFWRWVRRQVDAATWTAIHDESLRALEVGNEDATAFATTATYMLVGAMRAT